MALLAFSPFAGASDVVTREDAGTAAAYGQYLCGISPRDVDAFKAALDARDPGASSSLLFQQGWNKTLLELNQLRQRGSDAELSQVVCQSAQQTIAKVATPKAAPSAGAVHK